MARSKKGEAAGFLGLIIIGVITYLFMQNIWCGSIVVVVGLVLLVAIAMPRNCDICGNTLRRTSYTWAVDGKKRTVCPHCNQSLERKQSREAMKKFD